MDIVLSPIGPRKNKCAHAIAQLLNIELTRFQESAKATIIEAWANQISQTYNILPMDAETFRIWAKLMHKQSNTVYEDAMIAATAIHHHLTVVTRNIKDFKRFDVSILNPFEIERS